MRRAARTSRSSLAALAWLGACLAAASLHAEPANHPPETAKAPLVIQSQGAFHAGGTVKGDPRSASVLCDHGYVEYQIPPDPKSVSLFLWHSSSAFVWQSNWKGGEGYRDIFLRKGYPVHIWDGPRVGRANWGCEAYGYQPAAGADQTNFRFWRLGAPFGEWFEGVQFPRDDPQAWDQAMRARYAEFDTVRNAQLETDAAAAALERVGPAVLVTNSAGGFRALLTALKSDKVKGIVAYESPGYVFPMGEGPQLAEGAFGPVYVSNEEFARLTEIPMQFVWGDNVARSSDWRGVRAMSEQFVEIVNRHGGKAEILDLPAKGLKGNTHIPMADLNNAEVAELLAEFLHDNGFDRR